MKDSSMANRTDYFLDITEEVCPLTFVKTKLFVERMLVGETLEVRLNSGEPLTNVPRSVQELGHTIIELTPEQPDNPNGVHRLHLRKNG